MPQHEWPDHRRRSGDGGSLRSGQGRQATCGGEWGIGVDNVDFAAAKALGLPISNTPGMFAPKWPISASAICSGWHARRSGSIARYAVAAGRNLPAFSPAGRLLGLIGLGDIGRNLARRALDFGLKVNAYDPGFTSPPNGLDVAVAQWLDQIGEAHLASSAR